MAVPKYRVSKSQGRKRRTHYQLGPVTVTECPHCHEPKLPHRICTNCGYYGGKQVISAAETEQKG
ncbi:MAG: 50S ribosomal protein L32 [Candidatus Bipolaricaulia bacterium]